MSRLEITDAPTRHCAVCSNIITEKDRSTCCKECHDILLCRELCKREPHTLIGPITPTEPKRDEWKKI